MCHPLFAVVSALCHNTRNCQLEAKVDLDPLIRCVRVSSPCSKSHAISRSVKFGTLRPMSGIVTVHAGGAHHGIIDHHFAVWRIQPDVVRALWLPTLAEEADLIIVTARLDRILFVVARQALLRCTELHLVMAVDIALLAAAHSALCINDVFLRTVVNQASLVLDVW